VKVWLLAVGRPGTLFTDAVAEYEKRAARYWNFESIEVKEERAHKGLNEEQIRAAESERLLERVPPGTDVIALTREGQAWSSSDLARYFEAVAMSGKGGVAFLIGGALGLSADIIRKANKQISLSAMTLTHEMARVLLTEQIYRAGTITRGEPYHKARR
jgi:23S rRNA (pseudouridine1915-N3)-methyltransferase